MLTQSGMARHIPICRRSRSANADSDALLLQVTDRYVPAYWLSLELSSSATWADLDAFLRDTWLECCGHLSSFEHAGTTYIDDPAEAREWAGRARSLSGRLVGTVPSASRFSYTYDFGTSTELVGRVLGLVPTVRGGPRVQILARNEAPDQACDVCGQPATEVCGICYQQADTPCWYCAACVGQHHCTDPGTDYFLPVVNSPRVGLCAYTGPADGQG